MRVAYLVFALDSMGGTERTVVNQAAAILETSDQAGVSIINVVRTADRPHVEIDARIRVQHLLDVRDPDHPIVVDGPTPPDAAGLRQRASVLVPSHWDAQFDALCDVALEHHLPGLDVDVLVTVTPGLLAAATRLAPSSTVVVHQEHRPSAQRTDGLEPLLVHGPQADVIAVLTQDSADWLTARLGPTAPEIVVVANPLAPSFCPRSDLESRTIVSGGRFQGEKQWGKLIDAFALVADDLPDWRLRLVGDGPLRNQLVRTIRKHDLWDRVELPGPVADMAGEWAGASICALTSRNEALPMMLQEAMAAGVPCASFDTCTGPRDLIEHEVTGLLVTQESVVGMAVALRRLATDDDLRHRLGTAAVDSVRRRTDPAAVARRWVEVFAGALDRRGGRGRLAAAATRSAPVRHLESAPATGATTPVEARRAALELAVRCASEVTSDWLVVPPHETGVAVVVVPMAARDGFLAALAAAGCPPYLSVVDPARGGWPERRGTPAELATDLRRGRTPLMVLEPWPRAGDGASDGASALGYGCGVEVEFWEEGLDGRLVSPRLNRYTQRLPVGAEAAEQVVETEVDGVAARSLPLLVAPSVGEVRFDIDAVVTWVDGADPAWSAARERRLAETGGTAEAREASGAARYVSRDELRYCLRSLHLHAPWLRRIFLVTAGQAPDWLDRDHAGVTVVDHREILPADALPTFNSHAIEAALHRVPGLAEHFVYLNDDFLLARPVRPELFFSPAGSTAVVAARAPIGLDDLPGSAPYVAAAWNNRRLLQDAFGAVVAHHLAHTPYAHRRSVLEQIDSRFAEVEATRHAPFRSPTDVSTLSSLAQHYGLLTGTAHLTEAVEHAYVNLSNPDVERQLGGVLQRGHDVVCLADHHDHALGAERLDVALRGFLEQLLPIPAPWERQL